MGTMCYVNDNAIAFIAVSLLVTFVFLVYAMVSICCAVIFQYNRTSQYRLNPNGVNKMEKETAIQAMLYTLAFIITYMFPALEITLVLAGSPIAPFAMRILTSALFPLQGFWNCLFYIRPGVYYLRSRDPSKSILCAVWEIVSNSGYAPKNTDRTYSRNVQRPTVASYTEGQTSEYSSTNNFDLNLREATDDVSDGNWTHLQTDSIKLTILDNDSKTREYAEGKKVKSIKFLDHENCLNTSSTLNQGNSGNFDNMTKSEKTLNAQQKIFHINPSECAKDKLSVQDDFEPKVKIVSDEQISDLPQLRRKSANVRRVSLLSLSSVLSDMSLDSLDDDLNQV